ncbi:MAG: HAD-IA family hydrolase [Thermomicrobiales bacterium]|nr:HAD-IA family hydrolase [Thermomicrobiales bacterium]
MGTFLADGPVDLVTFDLYDTLIEMSPPRWERLADVLRALGIAADPLILREADIIAEDYFTIENGVIPIRDRSVAEREAFRLELMRRWLEAAGLPDDPETVSAVRHAYISEFDDMGDHYHYRLFDDVMPALRALRKAGLKTALISNADNDVTVIAVHFAFAPLMDLIVTSALVGYEKPDPRTFHAALEPLEVEPSRALHIGDQPKSDIVGALDVGMRAVLIDRYHRHPDTDIPTVNSLTELANKIVAGQREFATAD